MQGKHYSPVWAALFMYVLSACGGGGPPAPKPLQHHFDDMYIATVAMEEKQGVMDAQQAYAVAKMEKSTADANYAESGTKLDLAKDELKRAKIDQDSAKKKKKAAEESGDMNRVNAASALVRAADLAKQAADQKVTWIKANRNYLKLWVRYSTQEMYHQESKFELAKARLAKAKNIRPKNFTLSTYESQASERSRLAQQDRKVADQEKSRAENEKKKWKSMVSAADKAAGKPSAGNKDKNDDRGNDGDDSDKKND